MRVKLLLDSTTQQEIAQNLARAISGYFDSINAGSFPTGTESVGAVSQVPVTGVTLNKTELSLTVGGTETLTATVAPENATNKAVKWTTSDQKIATVDENGKVTAVAAGTATITATTEDGGKTASCKVTVSGIPVTGVTLNKNTLALTVGGSETLTATVAPSNAANKAVKWTTSDGKIATVDENGKVTAVAPGTATITVTTADGGKTASCTVTVTAAVVKVTGISLDKTSLELTEGDTAKLTATVKPDNASNKGITWSSSSNGVATVGADGTVTAKGAGTATVTVSTNDGNFKASCAVTVKAKPPAVIPVENLAISSGSLELKIGESGRLTAAVSPDNATDKTVTWTSSDSSVVSVDEHGILTAHKTGTVTITAKAGGKNATCTVTVPEPPSQPDPAPDPTPDPAPDPSQPDPPSSSDPDPSSSETSAPESSSDSASSNTSDSSQGSSSDQGSSSSS